MIINCPNCGNKISDKAKKCPHCEFTFSENIELANNAKMENYEDLDVNRVEELNAEFKKEYPEFAKILKNRIYRYYVLFVLDFAFLIASIVCLIHYLSLSGNIVFFMLFPLFYLCHLIGIFVFVKMIKNKNKSSDLIKVNKYYEYWLKEKGIYYSSDCNVDKDKKIYESIVVELKKEKL